MLKCSAVLRPKYLVYLLFSFAWKKVIKMNNFKSGNCGITALSVHKILPVLWSTRKLAHLGFSLSWARILCYNWGTERGRIPCNGVPGTGAETLAHAFQPKISVFLSIRCAVNACARNEHYFKNIVSKNEYYCK